MLETKFNQRFKKIKMKRARRKKASEAGFSLVETVIALTILLPVLLGVLVTLTYAVNYNTGNSLRAQSLAVLQQQMEILQSAKFSPAVTDQVLTGGAKLPLIVKTADGNNFRVEVTVDDNPMLAGVQIDSAKTLKEISVTVTPESVINGWDTSTAATIRRVRGN